MFIRCTDHDLKHSLLSSIEEISHLTRISDITFSDHDETIFDPINCLQAKISNKCEIILKFKVYLPQLKTTQEQFLTLKLFLKKEPIERKFLTEMFSKKLLKLEKKQEALLSSSSKSKPEENESEKRKHEVLNDLYFLFKFIQ